MKTRELEKFFRDFQKKREEDLELSTMEVIDWVFKEKCRLHNDCKKEVEYYVKQELNRIKKEERKRNYKEPGMLFEESPENRGFGPPR